MVHQVGVYYIIKNSFSASISLYPLFKIVSYEIPDILLQFFKDHIIKDNQDTTHDQNDREIEE